MSDVTASIGASMPSSFQNPFIRDGVTRVSMTALLSSISGAWIIYGTVEFKSGNTTGKQQFDGKSLQDVGCQIEAFINQLK